MSVRVLSGTLRKLSMNSQLVQNCAPRYVCTCIYRNFSLKPSDHIILEIDPQTGQKKKKKTVIIPKVTLLSGNNSVLDVVTLEEAQKIAKRRNFRLIKVSDLDNKSERPVYKLLSEEQYLAEDIKQKEHIKKQKQDSYLKGDKLLNITQNITEHDLETQVKKISKWLDKKYEVRVVISGDLSNMSKAEKVYTFLDGKLKKMGRLVQKRQKGSDIKFQVLPPKENKNNDDNKNSENIS